MISNKFTYLLFAIAGMILGFTNPWFIPISLLSLVGFAFEQHRVSIAALDFQAHLDGTRHLMAGLEDKVNHLIQRGEEQDRELKTLNNKVAGVYMTKPKGNF